MSIVDSCARVYGPLLQRLHWGGGQQITSRCSSNGAVPLTPILIKQYSDLLGVSITASEAKIKQAFYRKSLQLHPDQNKNAGSEEMFTEISNAYQALMEDRKKFHRTEGISFMRRRNQTSNEIRPWFQSHHARPKPPTPTKQFKRDPSKYKDFHNYDINYDMISTGVDKVIQNYRGNPGTWCDSYYKNQLKIDLYEHSERRKIEKQKEESKNDCIVM